MLKVGFIGLGNVSNDHVLGYLDSEEAEIVAACDVDQDAGRRWLERWSQPKQSFTITTKQCWRTRRSTS